ncbi:MAG: polysaccharide deacetylase family protein [Nitrococcus sp.]|nr:polysaccharide deacetylase family protein [Nitrococcus sp.]
MPGRLSILIYHRVLSAPDPLQPDIPDAALFRRHMCWLRRLYRVLPFAEALALLARGRLPGRAVAITFDDGYRDNYEVALGILLELNLSATFFISSGFLDGGRMWNDTVIETVRRLPESELSFEPCDIRELPLRSIEQRREAIHQLVSELKYRPLAQRQKLCETLAARLDETLPGLMMSREQVRGLHQAGMEIGAHTVHHPILKQLAPAAARAEIEQSKHALEAILGEPVRLFAYPNGKAGQDFGPEHAAMVAELGFEAAVTTDCGTADAGTNPYHLPRFTPWDRQPWWYVARLAWQRGVGKESLFDIRRSRI